MFERASWQKLGWTVVGLVAVGAAVWSGVRWLRSPDANELLARAYTEHRTIELRMAGAVYGPMRVERGAVQSHQSLPLSLLEAEIVLKDGARSHFEDPSWLKLQARALLLEWDYETAIKELDEALMLKPDDPDLLQDQAIAYFERAENLGVHGAIDYGEAAEDLSKALKRRPEDQVALFNRAIIFDRLFLFNQAIADLEHYLRIEPRGPWAGEAKQRVERLRDLVSGHQSALAEPMVDPVTFVRLEASIEGAAKIDRRIEDYQDLAMREWLPSAYSLDKAAARQIEALAALHTLARLLMEKHQDHWLQDLLEQSGAPGFASAVADLKGALKESDAGSPVAALVRAASAEKAFRAVSNRAGVIRAQVEQVHALQRLRHPDQCLSASRVIDTTLHSSDYAWLDAQLKIEQSACWMMLEQFDRARSYNVSAALRAQASKYSILQLRALGIGASIETDAGNVISAWEKNIQGLHAYWQNASAASSMRGHQFFDDLMYSAEDLERWNLTVALARESAEVISLTADRSAEALDRQHLATLAIKVGDLKTAETELSRANRIIASFHQEKAVAAYELFSEIDRAQIDLGRGLINEAVNRLRESEPRITAATSFEIPLSFYAVYGEALQKQGKNEDARRALQTAIRLASSNPEFRVDPSKRYMWMQELSKVYRALTEIEVTEGRAEEALMTWESFRALSTAAPSKPILATSPAILCQQISDRTKTVLIYAVLPHGLATWTCNTDGLYLHFVIMDGARIVQLARYFSDTCADRNSDLVRLQSLAKRLYDLFVAPIADRLAHSGVLAIDGDDELGNVPFEAFWGDQGYLAISHHIILAPAVLFAPHYPTDQGFSAHTRALVVGSTATVVSNDVSLLPAPDVLKEAKGVADKFVDADLLIASEATKARVEALLPTAEIFHYVGHALSDVRHEGLVLAGSTAENQSEIWGGPDAKQELFRRCKLVVLSACSTGRGNRGRREIYGDIPRAMLRIRVPHVVSTRWDVDSKTTASFMDAFYLSVLAGKPVSEAAHLAAMFFLGTPQTRHPYYWAAFSVYSPS